MISLEGRCCITIRGVPCEQKLLLSYFDQRLGVVAEIKSFFAQKQWPPCPTPDGRKSSPREEHFRWGIEVAQAQYVAEAAGLERPRPKRKQNDGKERNRKENGVKEMQNRASTAKACEMQEENKSM
jgi:hypothetical protein